MRVPVTFAPVALALVLLVPSATAITISDNGDSIVGWVNHDVQVAVFTDNPQVDHIICQAGPLIFEAFDTHLIFTLHNDGSYNVRCGGLHGAGVLLELAERPTPILIDQTPPTITFTPTPLPNANGWFNAPVTLHYQVTDASSGPYTPSPGQPFNNPSGDFQFNHDGAGQTVTVTVLDIAGNITTASYTVSLDTVKPTYALTRSPTPFIPIPEVNINNTDTHVTITPSDFGSGIDTFTVNGVPTTAFDQTFTAEGTTPLNIVLTDVAGNTVTATEFVKIDKTPPKIIVQYDRTPNANGWFNTPVNVTFYATDNSKVLCETGSCFVASETFPITFDGRGIDVRSTPFFDLAGNQAVGQTFINEDKTPPVVTVARFPQPNEFGWNNSDVTVHMDVADNLSGPVETSLDQTFGEGANQGVSHRFFDQAGNSTFVSVFPISVDKTPPTLLEARPQCCANENGWYNTNVLMTFFGADNLSGVPNSPTVLIDREGSGLVAQAVLVDRAGNYAQVTSGPVNIDKTPPVVSVISRYPAQNSYGWNNTDVTVTFLANDELSGVAVPTQTQTLSNEGANQSVTAFFRDRAGNLARGSLGGISIDKTPPTVSCFATPSLLWPPNHQMVDVTMQTSFSDADTDGFTLSGGPMNGINLQSLTSSVPKAGDNAGWDLGTPDTFGQLLAWRASQLPVYTFIYSAMDLAGNVGNCTAQVSVGR